MKNNAGEYIMQMQGYKAYIPKELQPIPQIQFDTEMIRLLSDAERSLARLDGIITVLPNPDLFIAMYVKKEALLSSQIEGTQASLEGVLEFEANLFPSENIDDIKEVVNYVNALNYGINQLENLPISLRLTKEIHKILLEDTRGASKGPGEFRISQNWIGPLGASLDAATFVPPPPNMIINLMGDLEKFIHQEDTIPPLIKISMIHSQFETIHPFLDGNGRMGRLLITLYLYWKKLLSKPVLYLSFYLKKNRSTYYDLLMKVRLEGLWEDWIKFFLKGVEETSQEAAKTAGEIIKLKDQIIHRIYENSKSSIYAIMLVDLLFESPLIDARIVVEHLKIHRDTANTLLKNFELIGVLNEITGKQRYKKYFFRDYIDIIKRGTEI